MHSIVTAQVAITAYTIAIAYLKYAVISDHGPVGQVEAEKVSPSDFFIWHVEDSGKQRTLGSPAAACTYDKNANTWRVELVTHEILVLQDMGSHWRIAKKRSK